MGSADSKLLFKRKIFRLADPGVIAQNDRYWDMFWKEPQHADDIFTLLTSHDIRAIKTKNSVNFYLLLRAVSYRFVYVANHPQFPDAAQAPKQELLNCARLLTRILPLLFEDPSAKDQEDNIFWKRTGPLVAYSAATGNATVGSLSLPSTISNIDNDKASLDVNIHNEDSLSSVNSLKLHIEDEKFVLPLGAQLVHSCVDLLFTKHFTIHDADPSNKRVKGVDYTLWEPGVGRNGKFKKSVPAVDVNRLEILRLLITLCSQCLYNTPQSLISKGSRFLTVLATSLSQTKLLTFICLLVNTVCRGCLAHEGSCSAPTANKVSDPSLIQTNSAFRELRCLLVTASVQVLTLALSYPIPSDDIDFLKELSILGPLTNNQDKFPPTNLVRLSLSRLHKPGELLYILGTFLIYLKSPIAEFKSSQESRFAMIKNKTPDSVEVPLWTTEIVMIIWELVQCNRSFVKGLVYGRAKDTQEYFSNELLVCLVYYVLTYGNIEEFKSTKRMISYFILYLTANQSILNNLLLPIKSKVYDQLPSHFTKSANPTTYRDLIVYQACHLLIYNTSLSTDLLTPTYFEWLYNLIPVAQPIDQKQTGPQDHSDNLVQNAKIINPGNGLSYSCCAGITQLVIKLSSPAILVENSMNPDLLSLLIRAVTNALLFNPIQSRSLIYVVVKNSRIYNNVFETIIGTMNEEQQNETLQSLKNIGADGNDNHSFIIEEHDQNDDDEGQYYETHNFEQQENSQRRTINHKRNATEEDYEINRALRPTPPLGMSEKAKGKLPINAPLSKTWSGLVAINFISKFINLVKAEVPDFDAYKSNQMLELLDRIIAVPKLKEKIHSIDGAHYNNSLKLQPLKFIWSKLSLGWYESILWGKIFNIEVIIHLKFQEKNLTNTLTNTINSFSGLLRSGEANSQEVEKEPKAAKNGGGGFFSKFTSWGLPSGMDNAGSTNNSDPNNVPGGQGVDTDAPLGEVAYNEIEYVKKTIIGISFFANSNIQLFKVKPMDNAGPSLMRPKGAVDAVADNLMKQFLILTGGEEGNDAENSIVNPNNRNGGEIRNGNGNGNGNEGGNMTSMSPGRASIQLSDLRNSLFGIDED